MKSRIGHGLGIRRMFNGNARSRAFEFFQNGQTGFVHIEDYRQVIRFLVALLRFSKSMSLSTFLTLLDLEKSIEQGTPFL